MSEQTWWTNFDDAYGGIIERAEGQPDTDEFYTYYDTEQIREKTAHLSKSGREILDVLLLGGYCGKLDSLIEASAILAGDSNGA